jgi:histidine triad (HIT) family protein
MAEEQCLFCAIAAGQVPSKKVYEDSDTVALLDINPRNKGHTLIVTKKHHETIMDVPEEEAADLFKVVRRIAIAAMDAVEADGVNIGQNNGKVAGQVIPHVHFHVIPRFESDEVKAGAEALLPPKRLEDAEMNKIAKDIRENIGSPEPKKEVKREQPKPRKEPEQSSEETDEENKDFKKIDFNF